MLNQIQTDTPLSHILTNLNVRVVDQVVNRLSVQYPLMDIMTTRKVVNGVIDMIYVDYRDGDATRGEDDVVIGDFNQGTEPVFSETYQLKQYFHKGYDILDKMLNDTFVSVGLFVSLIEDMERAIIRPLAKRMFELLVQTLDEGSIFDEVVDISGASDTEEELKLIHTKLTTLQTPSRDHLKHLPDGATEGLEFVLNSNDLQLVINAKYAQDYKYDVNAKVFNLGEIALPVSSIKVVDFDLIVSGYGDASNATPTLSGLKMFAIQNGKIVKGEQYDGSKLVNTPKLKSVLHRYHKFDIFEDKSKIAIAFKG